MDETKHVKTTQSSTGSAKVRSLMIGDDNNQKLRLSLWRDATEVDLSVADDVRVIDGSVYYSEWNREVGLSVNYKDGIKVLK